MTPPDIFNRGHLGIKSPYCQLLNYHKKKKNWACINVAFFTRGALVYPSKHLADRLELYIFAFKLFEWFILIKRKNLLELFLFVSLYSSVFIFLVPNQFWPHGLTIYIEILFLSIFTKSRKAFWFSYVGNFTALRSDSAWMLQLQESYSHLAIFLEEEIHEDSLILDFCDG